MPPRKKGKKRKAPTGPAQGEEPASDPPANGEAGPSSTAAVQPQDGAQQEPQDAASAREAEAVLAVRLATQVDEARAKYALEMTAEEHSVDAEAWAEAAIFWLCQDVEVADEAAEMGQAMEISLEEAARRKAEEKPIRERTAEELCEAFRESPLLLTLRSAAGEEQVVTKLDIESQLRPAFIDYLELERNCQKWWSCSRAYFVTAAEEAKLLATTGGEIASNTAIYAATVDGGQVPATHSLDTAVPDPPTERGNAPEQAAPNAADGDAALLNFLGERVASLQQNVFARPEEENTHALPPIFRGLDMTPEVVELLDDDE